MVLPGQLGMDEHHTLLKSMKISLGSGIASAGWHALLREEFVVLTRYMRELFRFG